MTQTEYAARRGVSKQYIGKLVGQGKIPLRDGRIDAGEADGILNGLADPARSMSRQPEGSAYGAAKATKTEFEAKQAALDWARDSGLVVDAAEVAREQRTQARKIRDRLMRVPREAAGALASCGDERECRAILAAAIGKALIELADATEETEAFADAAE